MFDGRKRKIAAAVFVATTSGLLFSSGTTTATADPQHNIDSVKAKVDRLYHQAELASDRYDSARQQLEEAQTTLKALNADVRRQRAKVDRLRHGVASMVVQQYQGASLSTASQMVLADNPEKFLDNLNAISAFNSQRDETMQHYRVELSRLKLRQDAVSQERSSLSRVRDKMADEKATIDKKAAAAKDELDELEAKQRQALLAGTYQGPPPSAASVSASGRAATAVKYAMAQVGKAYVYGAAGPSAFDCSGLTMRAWGAAGVGLPHSSSGQSGMGTPVSLNNLRPGDLVFYYHPVSHVGMYIGNGLIVNAENPSVGVKVTGLNSMPVSGARRF